MKSISGINVKKIMKSTCSQIHFIFRHESDKLVAMPIKGQKIKGANWPEVEITGNPEGPAEIWIQLVEHKDDAEGNPRPSPNGLFLKKDKKSKGFNPPPGIDIMSDGDGNIPGTEADGKKYLS